MLLLNFIKLPFVIKIFILSIFEWSFYTGFTVAVFSEKTVFPNQSMMAILIIKLAFNKGQVKN